MKKLFLSALLTLSVSGYAQTWSYVSAEGETSVYLKVPAGIYLLTARTAQDIYTTKLTIQ